MEVVTSLSQRRTAAAQCDLFAHKSVPVIFEPPCNIRQTEIHTAEPLVSELRAFDVEMLIEKLK